MSIFLGLPVPFYCRGNNRKLTLVIHISWRAPWMLLDNCCFQSVIPLLLDIFKNVTETASTLWISLFLYQLHLHFTWFSAFRPEITLLSFLLRTVLNVHALVFITSWAAPSCKSFPLEASYYQSVCCVLGLRNWLLSSTAWGGDSFLNHYLNQNLLLLSCDRQGLHYYFFK